MVVAFVAALLTPAPTCWGACPPSPAPGVVLAVEYEEAAPNRPCTYLAVVVRNVGTAPWATDGWAVEGAILGGRTLWPGAQLRFQSGLGPDSDGTIHLPSHSGWSLLEGVTFTDPQGQRYRSNYFASCDFSG